MPIDSALLASLEGPNEFETLKSAVEKDPDDFSSWSDLLGKLDDQDIATVRKYYDTFLTRFPLCYGYWKKYCDNEIKRGSLQDPATVQRVKSIWLRGVEAAPYCVDMWIYFMTFASVYLISEAREYFKKAVSLVGTDPKSGKLWDNYVMFETSCNTPETVAALYSQILSTPFKDIQSYWDPFMAFASQETVQVLATKEELDALESAYEEDVSNKLKSDEEKVLVMKQMLIDLRKATFEATVKEVKEREGYEKRFKRLYFHVKPLGQNDLTNWRNYLDYELIHGNVNSITVLFERCLIPCALYEEFWMRYVEWAHLARGNEDTMQIVDRCLQTYLPKSVSMLLLKAQLLEEVDRVDETRQYLDSILETTCPQLLEASIFYVELLLRHNDRDGAEELMERLATEDYGQDANAFIAVYIANYYWKVRKDISRARSVFGDNKVRCAESLVFWKFYLNFEYSVAEKPAEALLALLNDCLASSLSHQDKVSLYELYLHYSSTICTDVQDLLRLKADYSVWKLAARAEQAAQQEERASQKRTAPSAPVVPTQSIPASQPVQSQQTQMASYPAIPGTVPGTMPAMPAMPTDPNSPEYAQYYYQYYQYYGYPQAAATPAPQ